MLSIFSIIAFICCGIIAAYTGSRLWSLFGSTPKKRHSIVNGKCIFWLIMILASYSFLLTRLVNRTDYWLPLICNYVFAFVICLFFSWIVIDIIMLFYSLIFKKKQIYRQTSSKKRLRFFYPLLVMVMFIVGTYCASHPLTTIYQLNIDKSAKVGQLRIVQITDLHITAQTSDHFVQDMVQRVNALKPDYIVITGDTLDFYLQPYVERNMKHLFAKLNPTYDTLFIFGNHEHYGIQDSLASGTVGNSEADVIHAFEESGMRVLKDQIYYDDKTGIYFVGRDDYVLGQFDIERAELSSLLTQVDKQAPVILLDHQPRNLSEVAAQGVDVMFSGHTHAGQVFPGTVIVNMMYENPWGLYPLTAEQGQFYSVVSSGYGLWGPPLRLFTYAEIVVADIRFKN